MSLSLDLNFLVLLVLLTLCLIDHDENQKE